MNERKQNEVLKGNTARKTASPTGIYVAMVVIVLVVLGLAVGTVMGEYYKKNPKTIAHYAANAGIAAEEFITKYGLDANPEITKNSDFSDEIAKNTMPITKYAEFTGTTFEEMKATNGYPDDMPETVTFNEAQEYIPTDVADYAELEGVTAEEFLKKYGLDTKAEITAETDIQTAMNAMPVEKYAEYNGTTMDALRAEYGFIDNLPEGVTFPDAQTYVTMQKFAELQGTDHETFVKENCYGLTTEQLPPDMLIKDAIPLINEAYEALSAENATEAE